MSTEVTFERSLKEITIHILKTQGSEMDDETGDCSHDLMLA